MTKHTQTEIIQVTLQLIQTKQRADLTLTEIADHLGMTHAALYKHFRNKQALWTAVTTAWFHQTILQKIRQITPIKDDPVETLHQWLWTFATAKKNAYLNDPALFALTTQYVDNHPIILRTVLTDLMAAIDQLMAYNDPDYQRAETILSAFAPFTLPTFKETWTAPNYQQRFETLWQLIKPGLQSVPQAL
ncbi:TetR/AcrR family transcriptional regulator [Latilactobacillus graminis]|uniref:Transcriptional regulator n=2 Tax=Latilactobacillus graminis TaxID=60519 RepID=A0AA89I227_9LACO|nr:TetR/AcrR family transcriptional regulator [Latilactobacillus graminis]KRM24231.1 transcriptional regulator [Latilactobacillus graminis DSM 20719]QFP78789.1 TetR/AcrR family transcriptional regulator [Latilactobacillus graminis]